MEILKPEMPLCFAAPIQWYAAVSDASEILLLNSHIFPAKTNCNRIEFTGDKGRQSFSIPLIAESRKGDYRSVRISYSEHWQNHLINALRTAYGKSPFFEYYDYKIEPIISHSYTYLWDLSLDMLSLSLELLKVQIPLHIIESNAEVPVEIPHCLEIPYYQVFADKTGFVPGLSILDLLFNEGMDAALVLRKMKNNSQ